MVPGWWSDVVMDMAMTKNGGTSPRAEAQYVHGVMLANSPTIGDEKQGEDRKGK